MQIRLGAYRDLSSDIAVKDTRLSTSLACRIRVSSHLVRVFVQYTASGQIPQFDRAILSARHDPLHAHKLN
eukprot:3940296-Rhodomonas_salina.1